MFSTEGKAIGYLREMEKEPHVVPATALPLYANRKDFREFFAHYPTISYVVVNPQPYDPTDRSVSVEEFLTQLAD